MSDVKPLSEERERRWRDLHHLEWIDGHHVTFAMIHEFVAEVFATLDAERKRREAAEAALTTIFNEFDHPAFTMKHTRDAIASARAAWLATLPKEEADRR